MGRGTIRLPHRHMERKRPTIALLSPLAKGPLHHHTSKSKAKQLLENCGRPGASRAVRLEFTELTEYEEHQDGNQSKCLLLQGLNPGPGSHTFSDLKLWLSGTKNLPLKQANE